MVDVEPSRGPCVVVVMAALNEGETIGKVLAGLPSAVAGMPVRTVVVDDGSDDDTVQAALNGGAIVAVHHCNLGQGDGLRTGLAVARELAAVVVVTMDADGQHDPAEVTRLVDPILADEADYVQGSRFLGVYDDAGSIRHVAILGFTAVINVLARVKITDCTTGYRAIRASGLERMRLVEDRFSTSEIIMEAASRGLRMREVPVHMHRREVGMSKKPRGVGYPLGYLGAMLRSWVRAHL
jgi:glycosyltransferase involved in cell wall biosynthesis